MSNRRTVATLEKPKYVVLKTIGTSTRYVDSAVHHFSAYVEITGTAMVTGRDSIMDAERSTIGLQQSPSENMHHT